MTRRLASTNWVAGTAVVAVAVAAVWIWSRFDADLQQARARSTKGSTLIDTRSGPIEVQQAGAGTPLLVVHGSGGGHDQGMAFALLLALHGIHVIAVSRFGYLRTPMPADASAAAQADSHVCLLDALGIRRAAMMGGSAAPVPTLPMSRRRGLGVEVVVRSVSVWTRSGAGRSTAAMGSCPGSRLV